MKFSITQCVLICLAALFCGQSSYAQAQPPIIHQITLPAGESWCPDNSIYTLYTNINNYRVQKGYSTLTLDSLGMKDAEIRATQLITYLATNAPGTPNFNPHQGYDTLAASLGYDLQGENLDWSFDPFDDWQGDSLHIAAMLDPDSNVEGLSCILVGSQPYWAYDPGYNPADPPPTYTPVTPPPTTPAGDAPVTSDEEAFLTLINNYRAQNGVGPLQLDITLQNSSVWMSTDMGNHNSFGHTDSLGRDPATRMAAYGYPVYTTSWGENIAAGFPDAQSAFNAFMTACDPDSTGNCTYAHRANMLNSSFRAIGIGFVTNGNAAYEWYWTTDFGGIVDAPVGSTPPTTAGPVITIFTANPTAITAGRSTTLAWNTSGATSLSLSGVGNVTSFLSVVVTPTQTTTYTLTATNSGGSSTAQVTVTVTGAATPAPVISAFAASPATITAGQSSTLAWSVSGATTLSISSIGTVTGTSTPVSPAQTTTYTLTATNTGGSTTAQTTVTVNAATAAPPATPTLVSATAKSSSEVDLAWTASTGALGYRIVRNGSILTTVPAGTLLYADTTVSTNTSYAYGVQAYNAAGISSNVSNTIQVTTPGAPAVSTCPGPAVGAFTGCYYSGTELYGNPVLVRTDNQINFTWGSGSPAASVPPQNFSARWQGMFSFNAGAYVFTATMSDGMIFYIDGVPVKLAWRDEPAPATFAITQTLTQGNHLLTVEYYERTGAATAILSWPMSSPPPPTAAVPVISSFSATPSSITAPQSTTLSWNVSGATSMSINNGVGTVTGASITMSPAQTTTYTLTATNSAGSATAQTMVTVQASTSPQPPGAPTLVSATAKSATEVDVSWSASTGSVVGYQVLRNGSVVGAVPNSSTLSFADTTVSSSTSYTYAVQAYNAAGTDSSLSNTIQVTTPSAASTVLTCPGPAMNAFTGCYYNNTDLLSNPALVRTDNQINFTWGSGSPASSLTPENFSVRWQGMFSFNAGTYVFTATMSDGMIFYIDGVPVKLAWRDEPAPATFTITQTLTQGNHLLAVEYYERTGAATAILSWPMSSPAPPPTGTAPVISSFSASPSAVSAGQSSTLSWNVSGATTASINNGVGTVTGASIAVAPAQTTTYTLTATNSTGSVTAQTAVTVQPSTSPQAPPAPTLVSATAKSATEVDLAWNASSGSVAGYQIMRNGSVLISMPSSALSYADTTVSANTNYTYALEAYNSAGAYSSAGNNIQVTTPAAAQISAQISAVWKACILTPAQGIQGGNGDGYYDGIDVTATASTPFHIGGLWYPGTGCQGTSGTPMNDSNTYSSGDIVRYWTHTSSPDVPPIPGSAVYILYTSSQTPLTIPAGGLCPVAADGSPVTCSGCMNYTGSEPICYQ